MNQSDEELVLLCQQRNLAAFRQLLERYQNKLMAFIYSIVRDYHLSEDIFQETFIRVHQQAHRFLAGYTFKTWLYTIALNLCRDELRKSKRKPTLPLDAEVSRSDEKDRRRWIDTFKARGPTPREAAGARELEEILRRELAGISPEHRQVVIMNRLLGLKYREIAEVLGIPSGTVRSRLHYALEYLRGKMGKK